MDLAESGIKHLNELLNLLNKLKVNDIALFEHQYHTLAFGSFILIVGRPKCRLKFSWDGRDFFLDVSRSEFQNQSSPPQWEHLKNICLAKGESIFDVVLTIICEEYEI